MFYAAVKEHILVFDYTHNGKTTQTQPIFVPSKKLLPAGGELLSREFPAFTWNPERDALPDDALCKYCNMEWVFKGERLEGKGGSDIKS